LRQKKEYRWFHPGQKALALALALALVAGLCASAHPQSLDGADLSLERALLPEAARHFGVTTSWKPDEWKLSLSYGSRDAEILIGGDRLIVNEYLVNLSSPVKAENGSVTMGLEDSAELFTRLLGRQVSAEEIAAAGLILKRQDEAAEKSLIKSVRYITYPRFTRIIINLSGDRSADAADVRLLEGSKTLTVELPHARFMQPAEPIEVGGRVVDLIESVQTSDDAKLIVRTVPEEIKYEIQEHDDPPRIVLDVSPASPTIVTNFLAAPGLSTRTNGWAEPEPVDPRRRSPFTTVVIDPGHGGKDNGARGRGGLREKEVTLAIALKLKELIERQPGVKVALTRTGDYFVPLKERTAIANHAKEGMPADLFISIHTNAHKNAKVGGFESFYISDTIDPDAEATAAMENAVVALDDPDDFADADLIPILWDLQFMEFVSQSGELAATIQNELGKRLGTRNRGLRQGKFIVLAGVAMPGALVEIGFISNRVEEAKFKTADFRDKCAGALAAAVSTFKERRDVRLGLLKEESGP